jgi:hypothetical protein
MKIFITLCIAIAALSATARADQLAIAAPAEPVGHVAAVVGLGAPTGLIGVEAGWHPNQNVELVGGVGSASGGGADLTLGVRAMAHFGHFAIGGGAGVSFGDVTFGFLDQETYRDALMPYIEMHLRYSGAHLFVDMAIGAFAVASHTSYESCPFLLDCGPDIAENDHPAAPSASLSVGVLF